MIHVLMNDSNIDKNECFYLLRKYIDAKDRVCILAMTYFDDTQNKEDWDKQFGPSRGIWYRANQDVFYRYGIKDDQIVWVNPFVDDREAMIEKIASCDILMIPGGAPDLLMKRLKQFRLKKYVKKERKMIIGYSAGAMVQMNQYHITPDEDYPNFSYQSGFGPLEFDVEVHYRASKIQQEYIEKVKAETGKTIYAIYEDGGMVVSPSDIEFFGNVDIF